MTTDVTPTQREFEILKVLWDRREATVREVYEELRKRLPIVQNTVQAFLRTMEEKGLVTQRLDGRTFIYRPVQARQHTIQQLTGQLLQRAYDGAIDQLVQNVLSLRPPTREELASLEAMIAQAKEKRGKSDPSKGRPKS
jgi:BlaI family transcriptional regulator, penicillinase repressor